MFLAGVQSSEDETRTPARQQLPPINSYGAAAVRRHRR